ncbi:MAG TPA: hypothetical protein VGO60_13925 [Iamia sp.]|nr:hypothetical protein [Iamia sp.]
MAADPPPSLPGPAVAAGPATMLELGAALGADVWWCEQLFAVAGGWVPTTAEAGARAHVAELSRVAGDHAQALRALLPRPAPVDPAAWVGPPSPDAEALVAVLAGVEGTAVRLAVAHRVLVTRLVVAWSAPLGPSALGVARALRHARTDLAELRDTGETLLHALLAADPPLVEPVAAAVGRAEGALVAAGGLRPPPPPAPPT